MDRRAFREFREINTGPKGMVISSNLSNGRDAKMHLVQLPNWCFLSCSWSVILALELSKYSSLSVANSQWEKRNFEVMPKPEEQSKSNT